VGDSWRVDEIYLKVRSCQSLPESVNASVYLTESAQERLTLIRNSAVEVVICDIGMPEVDGYSFIRRVQLLDNVPKK
jgi:CheY-like chemotaxis protein